MKKTGWITIKYNIILQYLVDTFFIQPTPGIVELSWIKRGPKLLGNVDTHDELK